MKRFFVSILCLFYTFAAIGATFQVHQCHNDFLLTISKQKQEYKSCPLCKKHSETKSSDSCKTGDCKDIELKFDQLSDKLFNTTGDHSFALSPAVIVIPWIHEIPTFQSVEADDVPRTDVMYYADSSPPVYLTNCTFLI